MAGYSSKSLTDKLGIKPGMRLLLINATETLIEALPDGVVTKNVTSPPTLMKAQYDYIHFFTTKKASVASSLTLFRDQIVENGMIWISWPKKAARELARIDTDLSENIIRDYALQASLVDVKVCAIDEIWSALKLVIPIEDRKKIGSQH